MSTAPFVAPVSRSRFVIALVGLALVALAVRWPLMTSPAHTLDGDEALTAVMVLDLLDGEHFSLVVYGAAFGLALFELLLLAGFALLFGATQATFQFAVFAGWLSAIALLVSGVRRLCGVQAALLVGLLAVVLPAWIRPSFAAWAYNVSAFAFLALGVYSGARAQAGGGLRWWSIAGLSLSLAALTQPIEALALSAFLAGSMRRPARRELAAAATAFLVPVLLWITVLRPTNPFWSPKIVGNMEVLAALRQLPGRWWVALGGAYVLNQPLPQSFRSSIAGVLWSIALVALLAAGLGLLLRRRRGPLLGAAAGVAIVSAFTLVVNPVHFGYRYLLPGAVFLPLGVGLFAAGWMEKGGARRALAISGVAVLVIASIVTSTALSEQNFTLSGFDRDPTEGEALGALVAYLSAHHVGHVYVSEPLLQWQILFASNRTIKTRWRDPVDRAPWNTRAVDAALHAGAPVAWVGETHDIARTTELFRSAGYNGPAPIEVGPGFFVLMNPPKSLVSKYFALNPPS